MVLLLINKCDYASIIIYPHFNFYLEWMNIYLTYSSASFHLFADHMVSGLSWEKGLLSSHLKITARPFLLSRTLR